MPGLKSLLAALSFAIALGLTAASAEAVYERGNGTDPFTLDPQRTSTAAEANILRDLYEGLLVHGPFGGLIPGAAERWEISADGLVYIFHLRAALWTDGSAVTAADFVRGLRRLVDPAAAPDARLFRSLEGAEAIIAGQAPLDTLGVRAEDDATLAIRLVQPTPALLDFLARPAAMPIHRNLVEVPGIPSVEGPFNGAYQFERFAPSEGLWLVRNPSFRDQAALARSIRWSTARMTSSWRCASSPKGASSPTMICRSWASRHGGRHSGRSSGSRVISAPISTPPILRACSATGGSAWRWPSPSIATPSTPMSGRETMDPDPRRSCRPALPPTALPPRPISAPTTAPPGLAEARRLLAEAGFGAGNPLSLTIAIAATELNRRTAAVIAANLAEIGVMATVTERPAADHYAAPAGERTFDLASFAWIGDANHVSEFLGLFTAMGPGVTLYRSAEFDGLIAEAAITQDRTVQTALYEAADRLLMRDLPAIPLLHYAALNLVSTRLRGWEDNVVDIHLTRWMSIAAE